MQREIEVYLDHIEEDLSATVKYQVEFYRDSHGAPYGYEEWYEDEILKTTFSFTPSPDLKKDIEKEIKNQIDKDIYNRSSWQEIA